MSKAENDTPQPPEDLVLEGQRWAFRQQLSERTEDMQEYLRKLFALGVEIFQVHRDQIVSRIEEAGGVEKIINEYADSAYAIRAIQCKNGEIIPADEVLSRAVLEQQLPPIDNIPKARQTYGIRILFDGLSNVGFNHVTLQRFLHPDYFPHEIIINEFVGTEYDFGESYAIRSYSLKGKEWRPSIGGIDLGFVKADMEFTATRESKKPDGEIDRHMALYVDGYSIKDPTGTQVRLMRFCELLNYSYQTIVGVNSPTNEISIPSPRLVPGVGQ